MKDTEHIRQDYHSVTWVMPQVTVWDLGVLRGQNQIPSWRLSVMLSPPNSLDEIQPNLVTGVCVTPMNGACNGKFLFKDFYTKLCVCSHK